MSNQRKYPNILENRNPDQERGIPLWNSIILRLPLYFGICAILIGVAEFFIVRAAWRNLTAEVEQKAHWDLAAEIALRIQPLCSKNLLDLSLDEELYKLSELLPNVDFYFLDSKGTILKYYIRSGGVTHNSVPLAPILSALSEQPTSPPLLNLDPTSSENKLVVFSTAPLHIAGAPGYLYLVLESRGLQSLKTATGQYYILSILSHGLMSLVAISLILASILALYMRQRLRSLKSKVEAFRKGEYQGRVDVQGKDEISLLSTTLNEMANAIENRDEQLRKQDALRRRLIASLAHDLRGPLTATQGVVETLSEHSQSLSSEEIQELLTTAKSSIRFQGALVADLFELSKLEAIDQAPELAPFSLLEAVEEASATLSNAAKENGIKLDIRSQIENTYVEADVMLIGRVLHNLIGNAINYSPEGSTVFISISSVEQKVRCSIGDQGPGIPEEERELIFQPFHRTKGAKEAIKGGTGLGLAIVHRILSLHKTNIELESGEKGSTFSFSLPRA